MPSKAVVALSVALVIAVAMCVYLYLYPRGSPPELPVLPTQLPEWVKTVTEVVGGETRVYVTNICPGCRPELTRTLAKATVGPWEWSIVRIVEAEYIRYGDEPDVEIYKAREGTRFVIVTARIKHVYRQCQSCQQMTSTSPSQQAQGGSTPLQVYVFMSLRTPGAW